MRSDRKKATKAIILSRVSSKDQEDGYSLDVQTDRLEKYCKRNDLQILEKYQIVESSTQGTRKEFTKIIKSIKSQRDTIALVADKVDRVQRSQKESPILDMLVRQGKLELHFNSENYIIHQESTAHEMMMWGMGVVFAKSHTDLLSENVKKSLKRKVEVHGEWYGPAPLGYVNKRSENGKAMVVPDLVRAGAIKKIFESYSTGAYTLSQMVKKANGWGLTSKKGFAVNKSVIHRLIQNPFYYGEMMLKGELFPHCHEILISRETFNKCKEVRMGHKKTSFRYGEKDFLFRGLLKCKITGKLVVSDTKKKTNSKGQVTEWTYLRTYNPKDKTKYMWVREDKIIKQLEDILKNLRIKDPELLKKTMDYLIEVNNGKSYESDQEVAALKQEHTKNKNRLRNMVKLLADGAIDQEDFVETRKELRERQSELLHLIESYDKIDDKLTKKLVSLINITNNAYETFKSSTIDEKRELLKMLLSNLFLNGSTLEFTWAFPFDHMAKLTNCTTWRRERDSNPR